MQLGEAMNYWIGVDTLEVFEESRKKNDLDEPHTFGFPADRKGAVEKMRVGDRILNYMTGKKVFFAVWKVTKEYEYKPEYRINGQSFPSCVTVSKEVLLPPEDGIPFDRIKSRLKAFGELKNPKRWSVLVRPSARKFDEGDGEVVLNALLEQARHSAALSEEAGKEIARQKKLAEQATRPDQKEFSATLRRNYQSSCAITHCVTAEALEAAHVRVQKDTDDNGPENGLLLRSDIHALFDRCLITLSEDGRRVEVSDALKDPGYSFLRGATVRRPSVGPPPSEGNIRSHRERFFAKQNPKRDIAKGEEELV
jgi:hypothetical protein